MVCYLGMGWCIIFFIRQTAQVLGTAGMWLLALGGVAYTLGAVLYAIGKSTIMCIRCSHFLYYWQFVSLFFDFVLCDAHRRLKGGVSMNRADEFLDLYKQMEALLDEKYGESAGRRGNAVTRFINERRDGTTARSWICAGRCAICSRIIRI